QARGVEADDGTRRRNRGARVRRSSVHRGEQAAGWPRVQRGRPARRRALLVGRGDGAERRRGSRIRMAGRTRPPRSGALRGGAREAMKSAASTDKAVAATARALPPSLLADDDRAAMSSHLDRARAELSWHGAVVDFAADAARVDWNGRLERVIPGAPGVNDSD